ncbi:MAG: ligase-associated DNA damage response endonuclease PdeM [Bacteroidota bacterium]
MNATFAFAGEALVLLPKRAVWWPAQRWLIMADLHLGKVSHFRRHGMLVPEAAAFPNFTRLQSLIEEWQPERVLFLGDLFHSLHNAEVAAFRDWADGHPQVELTLVRGNHDILRPGTYADLGLHVVPEPWTVDPFVFYHHPPEAESQTWMAGHLHPAVMLRGRGRQSAKLPCFYCNGTGMILPAFGAFTGSAIVQPKAGDRVFVIAEDRVVGF